LEDRIYFGDSKSNYEVSGWRAGYQTEWNALNKFIHRNIRNVVFISGDLHLAPSANLAELEVLQKATSSLQKGRGQVNATTRGMRLLNGWTKNTANVPAAARPGALTEQLVTSVSVAGAQRLLGG